MKKLWILVIAVLFCGCELNQQEHYLVATANNNNIVYFNPDNKTLSPSEQLAYNTKITVSWYLLPESIHNAVYAYDDKGNMKENSPIQIELISNDCLELIPLKVHNPSAFQDKYGFTSLGFKAIKEGETKVVVKSDKYGSSTVIIQSIKIQ